MWWYHVNKYRAMRGNRSELAPGRKSPRCHVNTPLHIYQKINSVLFPDLFPRQWFLFPDSRLSDRSVVNRDIKKTQEQSFFHDRLQKYGRNWIRFDQNEKIFTYKALVVVALKKKIQVWKIAETFFKNSIVRTLSFAQGISIHKVARAHPRSESYFGSHRG